MIGHNPVAKEGIMPGSPAQTPTQLVCDLLVRDPDAASLLSDADHWHRQAAQSAESARRSCREAHTARRRFEELRHKLDPRNRRPLHLSAGLAMLAAITPCLLILDQFELGEQPGQPGTTPLVLCATAMSLSTAWIAVTAIREGRPLSGTLIAAASVTLSVLMAAVHILLLPVGPSYCHLATLSAIAALLINGLNAAAAVAISRTEPGTIAAARFRWHRVARLCQKDARLAEQDLATAASAERAWLLCVRMHVIRALPVTGHDDDHERIMSTALEIAAALQRADGVFLPCAVPAGPGRA
jgi:hypothetical protein